VTFRHVALASAAVLVMGVGVYLFLEVRASPAAGEAPAHKGPVSTPDPAPIHVAPPARTAEPAARPAPAGQHIEPPPPQVALAVDVPRSRPGLPDADRVGEIGRYDAAMSEANKAYDRGEFEEAKVLAQKLLAKNPGNVRMLRILVSASCIDGDTDTAQRNYLLLPGHDREQMKQRCGRYGVTFNEK
jgi:hypothetical protein